MAADSDGSGGERAVSDDERIITISVEDSTGYSRTTIHVPLGAVTPKEIVERVSEFLRDEGLLR